MSATNVSSELHKAQQRAGLRRQRLHDLRHAYATLMLENGVDLAVVTKSLGHANISTTADVYAHFTTAMADDAAARIDAILRGERAS